MDNKKLTLADFNEEIHLKFDKKHEQIHIDAFKDYCETFNIALFSKDFFDDPSDESLSSEREIKKELISFFKKFRIEILEYRYDYFTNNTVEEIANIIEKDIDRVIAYLERIKHTFQRGEMTSLSEYGDVTDQTRVENISSFKILKELQVIERQLPLRKLAEKRLKN